MDKELDKAALFVKQLSTGEIHKVRKYIQTNEGDQDIWCDTWYGHHRIGDDCEWQSSRMFSLEDMLECFKTVWKMEFKDKSWTVNNDIKKYFLEKHSIDINKIKEDERTD